MLLTTSAFWVLSHAQWLKVDNWVVSLERSCDDNRRTDRSLVQQNAEGLKHERQRRGEEESGRGERRRPSALLNLLGRG